MKKAMKFSLKTYRGIFKQLPIKLLEILCGAFIPSKLLRARCTYRNR